MMNKKAKLFMLSMPVALFAPVLSASCQKKDDFKPQDFKDVKIALASGAQNDFSNIMPSEFVRSKKPYTNALEVNQKGSKTDKFGFEIVNIRANDNYGYVFVEYKLFDKNNKKNITPKKFVYLQNFKSNIKEALSNINSKLYFSKTKSLGADVNKKDLLVTDLVNDKLLLDLQGNSLLSQTGVKISKDLKIDFGKDNEGIKKGFVNVSFTYNVEHNARETGNDFPIKLAKKVENFKIEGFTWFDDFSAEKFIEKSSATDVTFEKIKKDPTSYISLKNAGDTTLTGISVTNGTGDKQATIKFKLQTSLFDSEGKETKVVSDKEYEYKYTW
ncbi:MAG1050 family protein [Mycoplasmopsis agalactiae]|uniref:MAG1050 family protein n=1 Tax=Mycoplasmopsis agalactiae TaxID=2110 RepID=UPI002F4044C9